MLPNPPSSNYAMIERENYHRSNKNGKKRNSLPRNRFDLSSYKTQRLPRSADPSPQRTVERIELLGEKHGGNSKI